jgi:MFS family permease
LNVFLHREAGCTPFATSLIADYFGQELRGLAMGVYNWGIYTGYSLSYALGNFITDANINNQGWRW